MPASVYGVWKVNRLGEEEAVVWSPCSSKDTISVRSLYCNVVPGLVQQVEPLPKKNIKGVWFITRMEIYLPLLS